MGVDKGPILGYRKNGRPIYRIAGGSVETGTETVTIPVVQPPAPPAPVQPLTAADIERIQQETAERVRAEIRNEISQQQTAAQEMQARIGELSADLAARQEREREAERQAQEAAEAQRRAEQTALERVNEFEQRITETNQRFEEELARRDAVIAQERRLTALSGYREQALTSAGDEIMPHLREYVRGNSEQEIDASVARARETSASILADVAAAQQQQQQNAVNAWRATPTVAPTGAPAGNGPLDQQQQTQSYSAADISAMDPATYAQHRERLLAAASQQRRAQMGA